MILLERDDELSVLDDLIARAANGAGRVAVLSGPPGIGKSTLLALARHRVGPGVRVVTAASGELDRDLPFGVVRQLFESTVRARTADGTAMLSGAATLAAPVFAFGTGDETVAALGDVVHGLFWLCADLAEQRPLLLTIDDVQWADDASLRFLSHLARRIDELPVVVLAAGRAGSALDELAQRVFGGVDVVSVQPAPLSHDAVATLVRGRLGGDADDVFCIACAAASGGNPFLLTEALDTLQHEQVHPRASEVARVATLRPRSISRTILSRIARLGPEAVRLARALAVLGPKTGPRQLADFAGLPPDAVARVVDALSRESIVTPGRPTDFVHPLVREAVYGDMSALLCASEHKRAARLLDGNGASVEQVAAQLQAAQPESDQWVVATLRRGAAAALARGAPESAVTFLTRARAEPPQSHDLASVDAELARSLGMTGRLTEAAAHFREAIEGTEDPFGKLALALEMVVVLHRAGRGREAVAALQLARRFIDWDDPDLPPEVQAVLAAADFVALEPPSAWTSRLNRIAAPTDGAGEFDRTVLAIRALGGAVMGDRPAGEVADLAARAAAGPVPHQDGGLLVVMAGSALAVAGRNGDAADLLGAGIENAQRFGNRSEFCYLAVVRSHVEWFAGRLLDAEADARAGLVEYPGEPRTLNTVLAAAVLIDALVERGAVTEAVGVSETFELDRGLPGDALIEHFVPTALGALRLAEHRPAEALLHFLRGEQLLISNGYVNPGFAQWWAGAIAAHAALGNITAAADLAAENLDRARSFGAPGPIALALRMSARVHADTRLAHLADAADLLSNEPALLERAHVLVEFGTELCRTGHRDAARTPLTDGLELAAHFDARPVVATARRELRLLGLRPRRTSTTGLDALTASERRVATLAADGAANREIAQALFVTTRTVEAHLTSSYRKLRISGRGELADALRRPRVS